SLARSARLASPRRPEGSGMRRGVEDGRKTDGLSRGPHDCGATAAPADRAGRCRRYVRQPGKVRRNRAIFREPRPPRPAGGKRPRSRTGDGTPIGTVTTIVKDAPGVWQEEAPDVFPG